MCRCEGYSFNACWASPTTLESISPERSSRALNRHPGFPIGSCDPPPPIPRKAPLETNAGATREFTAGNT